MPNEKLGSSGAKADEAHATGREQQGAEEASPLADSSPGAAADRKRSGAETEREPVTEEFDELSPGLTAEAETDSS